MENLNLIRKIAWSFFYTTGLEYEDLFSEACLAYCECVKKYDKNKSKITTFAHIHIRNHLINYINRLKLKNIDTIDIYEIDNIEYQNSPLIDKLSISAQIVLDTILSIKNVEILEKNEILKKVESKFEETNQSMKTLWVGVKDIKLSLNY